RWDICTRTPCRRCCTRIARHSPSTSGNHPAPASTRAEALASCSRRHTAEPLRRPPLRGGAVVDEDELLVGPADEEWPHDEADGDVEPRHRAAALQREAPVDDDDGGVAGEDADHLVGLEEAVRHERFAAPALELERRRPARRPAWLVQPERGIDGEVAACRRLAVGVRVVAEKEQKRGQD
ncbi:Os01g0137266, partial [Oryza sativa Japonica Group]